MTFVDTGLLWIPTSPNMPEASTPWYYPATGILGELQIVSIGVGYTLPFKVVGAPWIDAKQFSEALNAQNMPGVYFHPFYYRPFFGKFSQELCQGVLLTVTDQHRYLPVQTQYLLIGILKSLYPNQFQAALETSKGRREMFCKVNGTDAVYDALSQEKYIVWKLRELHKARRDAFKAVREKYLIQAYD
jgi:uncharacterized protein YbbC (DUF1343 family)